MLIVYCNKKAFIRTVNSKRSKAGFLTSPPKQKYLSLQEPRINVKLKMTAFFLNGIKMILDSIRLLNPSSNYNKGKTLEEQVKVLFYNFSENV